MAKKRRKAPRARKKRVRKARALRPTIGFLYSGSKNSLRTQFTAFHVGLKNIAFVNGQNVDIIYRSAEDNYTPDDTHVLDGIVGEFVGRPVQVIVAAGGPISALRARHGTRTIPIVFTTVADPIGYGLVDRIPNTTTNATGTAGLTTELDATRLGLLKQLLPNLSQGTVGVLVNPNRPKFDDQWRALVLAANAMGLTLADPPAKAGNARDLHAAFQQLRGVTALLVTADPFFNSQRKEVLKEAKQLGVPAIYQWREFAEEGGLMSYGTSIVEAYELAGEYVGRILRDHLQPPQLPPVHVIDPSELNPVINLGTAERLNPPLDIPYPLLARSELIGDD